MAWPSRPLKIEVGYPPGGNADGLAHVLAHQLGRSLHAEVVVIENRPASAGTLATSFVARAPADGYTLLIAATAAVTIAPLLDPGLSYSTERNLCPLALVAETPYVLIVPSESQIATLEELIVAARRQPGALSYASLGMGSIAHAIGVLFSHALRLEITEVGYRNSATAVKDLLGGHVSMMFGSMQATLPAILAGQLRALAVSSAQRAPALPGIPTLAERGLADLTFTSWYGLFTPCGLPRDVEGRLIAAAREAIAHPDIAAVLGMDESTQPAMVGEDFGRFLQAERARWIGAIPLLLADHENTSQSFSSPWMNEGSRSSQ